MKISTDTEYRVAQEALKRFNSELSIAKTKGDDVWYKAMRINALKSQIADLVREISDYASLKSGQAPPLETYALEDLPRALVQARIAKGMTQADLAERLGIHQQQVHRYEATDYMSASLRRLVEVSKALKSSGTAIR